jgi:hypothetical protein
VFGDGSDDRRYETKEAGVLVSIGCFKIVSGRFTGRASGR